jgi:hypothetical protein
MRFASVLAVVVIALWRASTALAQGCAMCGNSFGANDPTTNAFASSVLFLIAAPYAIFFTGAACIVFLYRRGMLGRGGTVIPMPSRRTLVPADDPKEV